MIISTLKNAVKGLMFANDLDDDDSFYYAVNRALMRVRSAFPKNKVKRISQNPLKNLLGEKTGVETEVVASYEVYANDVASYYFEGCGQGHMTAYYFNPSPAVSAYEELYTVDINSFDTFGKYRGFNKRFGSFVSGRFKFVFSGEYRFIIKNFALYDRLISPEVSAIPDFSEFCGYDLNKLTREVGRELGNVKLRDVFISLTNPIKLIIGSRKEDIDYLLEGAKLYVPRNYCGEIEVRYSALPDTVGEGTPIAEPLDFPEIIVDAAAYLVAANLLTEENLELANYYLAMYKEAENRALYMESANNATYYSSNNWC